ncbi:MAG: hypothetical protein JWO33_2420 [Caulobacteraceae bacterium]|nr:hypothetical protein [Caulobacteraceae bacterium]
MGACEAAEPTIMNVAQRPDCAPRTKCVRRAVSDDPKWNAALDPTFFEGRLLIDILSWNWNLHVTVPSEGGPQRSNEFEYGRDFTISGRVRAPREVRGKSIKVPVQTGTAQ